MILLLNVFALALSVMIGVSIFIFNCRNRNKLFYIQMAIILIPAFAELRQILVITGYLQYFPFYIFLVYFLLRLIGPLINWHAHLQFDKRINFFNGIHVITYISWAYTIYLMLDFYLPESSQDSETLINQFKKASIFAYTYPIVQLLHIIQAASIVFQGKKKKQKSVGFMKMAIITILVSLVILQISYFIFSRDSVELIVAPLIFIFAFFALIALNIKHANVYAETIEVEEKSHAALEFDQLSERENEVLQKIALGLTDKRISDELCISVHTVATYCRRIYTKLNVKNRTEASFLYNSRVNEPRKKDSSISH